MRAYVITSGTIFGLLVLAHLLRLLGEGSHLASDPWYVLITLATVVQQAVDYWTNDPRADSRAADRLSTFATAAAESIREADAVPTVPEDRSAGISPDYVGWYEGPGRGRVAVSMHPDGMEAAAGALRLLLAGLCIWAFWLLRRSARS